MISRTSLLFAALLFVNPAHANLFKATAALKEERYQDAKAELTKSSEIGNAEAQFLLGLLNYQGKAGTIDKKAAMAWFFMAAEYDYPNSVEYARQIYQELDTEQQTSARKLASSLKEQFGVQALQNAIFPTIYDEPINAQRYSKNAEMKKRGDLEYPRGSAATRNQSVINSVGRNFGTLENLDKLLVSDDTGIVVIQYDVAVDGKTRDAEVLFSWPMGRFDKSSLKSVNTSDLIPALDLNDKKAEQYGLLAYANFGMKYSENLKTQYPHLYSRFKTFRNKADESLKAKYIYACFLRAYERMLPEADAESFQPVLLDAAKQGYVLAQYDYATYQIYLNNNLDDGLSWLQTAAQNGFAKAQYKLGDLLHNSPSEYLEHDIEKAKFWLRLSAESGYLAAKQKLIKLEFNEQDVSPDFSKQALTWLEEIVDNDNENVETYFLLAKAHFLLKNKKSAAKYIDEAIDAAEDLEWDTEPYLTFKSQNIASL